MNGFIQNAACISPFNTFEEKISFTYEPKLSVDVLKCEDPDLKAYVNPKLSRRMSPIIKRSVACAKKLHLDFEEKPFDAIIVGTGLGCLKDTIHFIDDVTKENEQLVSPTAFIQSTHNTVGGQIALSLEQTSYNMTYSQRGASFSNALMDALLLLKENKNNVLIGAADEFTETSQLLLERLGLYKKGFQNNESIYTVENELPFSGEGIAYFHLSNTKSAVEIIDTKFSSEISDVKESVDSFLSKNGITTADLQFILTGKTADSKGGLYFDQLSKENTVLLSYKHLTGEFHTADALGLWYLYEMMKQNSVPSFLNLKSEKIDSSKKYALLYNNFFGKDHSFVLVKKHD